MKAVIKKISLMLCIIVATPVIIGQEKNVDAENETYIDYIELKKTSEYYVKDWPPAIGCDVEPYCAIVHMSDGTIATDKSYTDMNWKIERYDTASKTYTTVKIQEGESIDFWMPYGSIPGQYKITATSKIDSDISGYTWKQLHYPWYCETYCICQPGKIKYGKITGRRPGAKDIRETYDWNTEKYTSVLPKCTYKTKDYTFIGWEKDGKIYKPGEKYQAVYANEPHKYEPDKCNAYFAAKWKPNFKKPQLVAKKAGKNKIKLRWNRMIGGKGYKIYRAAKKNGKYKIVGTVKNRWKTAWTDKKIKSGKTYYYRVAAYKKLKKKIVQRKSAWAMVSTKAAKVNSVRLSKKSVRGKVGQSTQMKATVKTTTGKRLGKKSVVYIK